MNPIGENSFTTNRLTLNPLCLNDNSFILELVNTPGWLQYIGDRNVKTTEDAQAYIQKVIDNPNLNYWVVRLKEGDIPIGIVTFIKREYLAHHDIGFAFLPGFMHKGYAFEATKVVLNKVSETAVHNEINAVTINANNSSIKLLERLGFHLDREIVADHESLLIYTITTDRLLID